MTAFRIFLIAAFLGILVYTGITISNHGMNLLPVFFGDMKAMAWPGQFNFDFMMFLALSALWTAWRNKFSAKGLVLALFALFGGMLFLSAYLFFLSLKSETTIDIMIGSRGVKN